MCEESSVWSGCAREIDLHCPYWGCVPWATWQNKGKTALLQMRVATPDCQMGTCNPFNLTILDPEEPKWRSRRQIGVLIYGQGTDPGTLLLFKRVTVSL